MSSMLAAFLPGLAFLGSMAGAGSGVEAGVWGGSGSGWPLIPADVGSG